MSDTVRRGSCAAFPQHIFQWLTKRPERAAALADTLRWPENIWIGATIEEDKEVWRADELRKIPVATKFISAEPLAVDAMPSLDLTDISWLIVGGESGSGAPEWAGRSDASFIYPRGLPDATFSGQPFHRSRDDPAAGAATRTDDNHLVFRA